MQLEQSNYSPFCTCFISSRKGFLSILPKNAPKTPVLPLCAYTVLDNCQFKRTFTIFSPKLFAHTIISSYLCIVKRKKPCDCQKV